MIPEVQISAVGEDVPGGMIQLAGKSNWVDKAETIIMLKDVEPTQVEIIATGRVITERLAISYINPQRTVDLITEMYGEDVTMELLTGRSSSSGSGGGGGGGGGSSGQVEEIEGTEDANGLDEPSYAIVHGPESAVEQVIALIRKIDIPPPQVEITTTITDIRVDKEKDEGFLWSLPGLRFSELSVAGDGFKVGKVTRAPFSSEGTGSFSASFDAEEVNSNTTVLSKTTLVAVEGKSASFLVGDKIPYETAVAGDGTIINSVEFEEIGLGLDFAPSVDDDGLITLYLAPAVRSFSGFSPAGYPIVATREAETIIRVRDGDMIVIGGLLRDEELKTMTGIPLLKDIPSSASCSSTVRSRSGNPRSWSSPRLG